MENELITETEKEHLKLILSTAPLETDEDYQALADLVDDEDL